jgi:nucleotide-binding universal stress UspA family protein
MTTIASDVGQVGAFPTGYRDIAVHLDGSPEDEIRLAHAESLAAPFSSHLTGIFTNRLPDVADYSSPYGVPTYLEVDAQLRKEGEVAHKRLAQRLERLSAPYDLRKLEGTLYDLTRGIATVARCADLLVTSCAYRGLAQAWTSVIEAVLFEAGHSVFLVPPSVKPREAIRTVLVGWVNTRESARAVSQGLPVLRRATLTEIVSVEEPSADGTRVMALTDIATYLNRHGATVNIKTVPDTSGDSAVALLREAHRISADLIVAGAYGHSRLREWILGGATRDLIGTSDIPLLMAH